MGYGLLRGEAFKKERQERLQEEMKLEKAKTALKNPKSTHPTSDKPDKPPNKSRQPTKDTDTPKTKKSSGQPIIKRPQPNSPKLSYVDWLEGVKVMKEIDKHEAWEMLRANLGQGFSILEEE